VTPLKGGLVQVHGVIYKVTNTVNGKVYVGKTTTTAEKRWYAHCDNAKYGRGGKCYFYRAILKYGKEKFTVEVIDQADTAADLSAKEIHWIASLRATESENGYNCLAGGEGGKHGPSSRALIKGVPRTPEVRAKISAAHLGKKLPRERVERQRLKLLGRKQTPEAVKRRTEAVRKAWKNPELLARHRESCQKMWAARPELGDKLRDWHRRNKEIDRRNMAERSRRFWDSPDGEIAKKELSERSSAVSSEEMAARLQKAWNTRRANGPDGSSKKWSKERREKSKMFWKSEKGMALRHKFSDTLKNNPIVHRGTA